MDIVLDEFGLDLLDFGKKLCDVIWLFVVDLNGWSLVDVDGNFIWDVILKIVGLNLFGFFLFLYFVLFFLKR